MDLSKISAGKSASDINVVIEIPQGGAPVKYEIDKDSSALFVDRFLGTAMYYPANYGFVPNTLGDDGDPVDVLVITPGPLVPGSVIRARPIGALKMTDEKGGDEKILAVPHDKLTPFYADVKETSDLPAILLAQIEHFFTRYKDLEPGKWVKVDGWATAEEAQKLIEEGLARVAK